MRKTTVRKRMLAGVLSAVLAVTALPLSSLTTPQKEVKAVSVTLQNPRIVKDGSMQAGQKVTWDCIWFGSYPQREVVANAESYDAIFKGYYNPQTDIIEDGVLFQKLERASGWSNNEIVLDGNKYRRMKQEDATYSYSGAVEMYRWNDSISWHYFRYEPIKWRVLSTVGNQAFLQADLALDDQMYNNDFTSVTWETSSMRSWLNGYGPETNEAKTDYRSDSFLQDAFSNAEQQAIRITEVENADNLQYETEGGKNTTDKIFLLSGQEVYGIKAVPYGFAEAYYTYDEARRRKSSTYAKAKGVWSEYFIGDESNGNCNWWLRAASYDMNNEWGDWWVGYGGNVVPAGIHILIHHSGVCLALNLNLSSSDLWSYAGTVCSDGTVNGQASPWTAQEKETEKQPESQKQTESQKQPEKEENLPKAGDMIRTNDAVYRITKMAATGNTVTLEKPLKKTNRTFNVPASIKSADGKTIFRVTGIAKNAFRKNTKLAKVVFGGNLAKIGANAFSGCKNLKTIRIASTSLTKKSVGKNAFKGIHKKAVIKVPKKKLKAYRKFLKGKGQAKSVKIKK